jgi:hypothetical protein
MYFLFQAIKYNLSKLKIYLNQWSSRLQVNLFFPFILISSLTLLGVSKKTGKPIKPRKSEKKNNQKNQTEKKTD